MNIKAFLLALTVALAPTVAPVAFGAGVYKWTDDAGITHFGDRQPVGRKSETIDIHTGRASEQGSTSATDQLKALEDRQQQTAEQQKVSAVQEAQQKQRDANCKTAKNNLNILKTNGRIRVEEDGKQRYLSPEEIEDQRKKFQAIADENCSDT